MTLFTKNELLEALKDVLLDHNFDSAEIKEVVIDSRKATRNTLFIALKGETNDGHDFVAQALESGCKAVLVHNAELLQKYHGLILVKNTFDALYKLAQYSRQNSSAKIIAVTGSVGKTGVKEMLRLAFATQGKAYATVGNLNNHYGLPLTLCNMPRTSEFAILEMGMNHLHEIEPLSKLAQPDIAVITTIAPAHIGNFKNEEEIALAKSEIFSGLKEQGVALLNCDNKYFNFLKKRAIDSGIIEKNILSFGKNINSTYRLAELDIKGAMHCVVKATTKNRGEFSYEISVIHQATIINSLIILACLDLLGNDVVKGMSTLKTLRAAKGRGEIIDVKIGEKHVIIVDDSYNANVASMKAGIEYLSELKRTLGKKRAVAILGDMFELGEKSADFHEEVLKFLQTSGIDFALLAGNSMHTSAKILDGSKYKTYSDSTSLALEIKDLAQDGDIFLIKGSRGMKMEKVIEEIQK